MSVRIEVENGSSATVDGPAMMHVIGAADAVKIGAVTAQFPRIAIKDGETADVTGPAIIVIKSDVAGSVLIDGEPVVPIAPTPPGIAPTVTSLAPDTAVAGDATDITMVVTGTLFAVTSVITFNGHDEPTTFIDDTQVSTIVKPSLFVVPADCPVAVRNGSDVSNEVMFSFTAPAARSGRRL